MRLDPEQKAAAALGNRPVRVVAGAGTGKTAVIAERFRRLVVAGAAPASILVMTFTDRAAAEMRERIETLTGSPAPAVGTFHAQALAWLRADGRSIGVPAGFRIVTGADRWILARELMWELGDAALTGEERPDDLVTPALRMLERMKQELVPVEKLSAWAASAEDVEKAQLMQACVRLFTAYELACRKQRLLDFDDLLTLAVRMLETRPAVKDRYRAKYPHVLVDEYQDLNLAQERLVELLAADRDPFVVGDDDQSIYRFRGASRASLERFEKRFPRAQTVTLGRNHRSSRRIVSAASALIAANDQRLVKHLRSSRAGDPVEAWSSPDGETEADAIAEQAGKLLASGLAPAEVAVLCRTNAIARPIAEALAARGLPYVVIGGHGFHDREEIRDVIALLRVLRDPNDVVALVRTLTRPPLALDEAEVLATLREAEHAPSPQTSPRRGEGATVLEVLGEWEPAAVLTRVLSTLVVRARTLDVRDLFFELMEGTRYLDAVTSGLEASEGARASANVSRFAELMAEWCETSADRSLETYMRHLDLVLLSGEDEGPAEVENVVDAIHVMTIHQAKGLEFDAVFVPGLVEGRLPQSGRSPRFELPPAVLEPLVRGREDVIAEERRLLYVAMTRARRFLYLSRAAHYEGGRRWRDSRFLAEVQAAGLKTVRSIEMTGLPRPSPHPLPRLRRGDPSGGEGDVVLSYSSISTYRECPKQYWYRYEHRLRVVQSPEAARGVILHDVLKRAAEERRQGKVSAEQLMSIHDTAWSTFRFPDARRAATFEKNGAAQLERYLRSGGLDAAPEYVEHPFEVDIDGWTLRGIIDRIDRIPSMGGNGAGWRIVDYKTGRPIARAKRDLQVELYALAAKTALSLEPVEMEIVYLASGDKVSVKPTGSALAEARKQGGEVAQAVREGRFEARPDRRRCRLCPYRLCCREAL